MGPEELAESVAIKLGFSLPYLLGAKTEDEAVKALGAVEWNKVRAVWTRLLHHIEARPALLEAAQHVISTPGSEAMAAFQQELEEAFRGSAMLMSDIQDLTREDSHSIRLAMPSKPPARATLQQAEFPSFQPTYVVLLALATGLILVASSAAILRTDGVADRFTIILTALLVRYGFLTYFATKFGLKKPFILGLAALAPGGFLIAGLSLVAYLPPHLTQTALAGGAIPQHGELQSWSKWFLLIAVFPIILFAVLALVNANYYLYFFENISGVLLFLATLFAYGLAIGVLWIGFQMRRAYTSPRLALASGMSGLCITFVTWSVMLGPATAKVVTLFSK